MDICTIHTHSCNNFGFYRGCAALLEQSPVAKFEAQPTQGGPAPLRVTFIDKSTGQGIYPKYGSTNLTKIVYGQLFLGIQMNGQHSLSKETHHLNLKKPVHMISNSPSLGLGGRTR